MVVGGVYVMVGELVVACKKYMVVFFLMCVSCCLMMYTVPSTPHHCTPHHCTPHHAPHTIRPTRNRTTAPAPTHRVHRPP